MEHLCTSFLLETRRFGFMLPKAEYESIRVIPHMSFLLRSRFPVPPTTCLALSHLIITSFPLCKTCPSRRRYFEQVASTPGCVSRGRIQRCLCNLGMRRRLLRPNRFEPFPTSCSFSVCGFTQHSLGQQRSG